MARQSLPGNWVVPVAAARGGADGSSQRPMQQHQRPSTAAAPGEGGDAVRQRAEAIVAMIKEAPRPASSSGAAWDAPEWALAPSGQSPVAKAGSIWAKRAGLSPLSQPMRMSSPGGFDPIDSASGGNSD